MFLVIVELVVAFARAFAVPDMIFEADLVLSAFDVLGPQIVVACAQRIEFADHVENCVDRPEIGIRTEILGAVLDFVAGRENAGKGFVLDAYPRITFIVLKQDIIARLQFLDQVVFKQQRIRFGRHDDVFDLRDLAYHDVCPAGIMYLIKIRRDTLLDVFGFSDVQDLAVLIEILVNPGVVRQGLYL